jgi:hypothetical protein
MPPILSFSLSSRRGLNEFRRLADAVERSLGVSHEPLHTMGLAGYLMGRISSWPAFVPEMIIRRSMRRSRTPSDGKDVAVRVVTA